MYECIKDLSCIMRWFSTTLFGAILISILGFLFLRRLPQIIQSIKISKLILKNNRTVREGVGWGEHLADRFLDIWYSQKEAPLHYGGQGRYNNFPGSPNSKYSLDLMDEKLKNLKLIEPFDSISGYKAARAIYNFRNRLIIKITKFYLIKFIGDSSQFYKNLEEQKRKNNQNLGRS